METTGTLILDTTKVASFYKEDFTEEEWNTLLDIIANWKEDE